jgi:nucleoside-diphosphate-sugar epimerase
MLRYLLTGDSGFLGSYIKNNLSGEIKCLGRNSEININISNPFILNRKLKFDCVIHSAGKAHQVPENFEDENEFFQINFEGTKNLCSALDQLDERPNSFIFISTVSVYGKESGLQIDENHPKNGITPYAKSKIMAEEWLINWAKMRNITLGVLRLPLVAGKNPPGNLGKMINGINSGNYLSIGNANVKKSLVWAEDIAGVIPKLAEIGGIYNLTDGYHPTFRELEVVISKSLGKKSPKRIPILVAWALAKYGDTFGNRVPFNTNKLNKIISPLTFDDSAARLILGWKPSNVLNKLEENI